MNYGTVPMAPIMFQDDLADSSETIRKARETKKKINLLVKQHCLDLNRDKTVCVLMGSKKQQKETSEELAINPLWCGDFEMKEKKSL